MVPEPMFVGDAAGVGEAFHRVHALLETTVDTAERDDIATLSRMTTELRDGCVGCHEEFRGQW